MADMPESNIVARLPLQKEITKGTLKGESLKKVIPTIVLPLMVGATASSEGQHHPGLPTLIYTINHIPGGEEVPYPKDYSS